MVLGKDGNKKDNLESSIPESLISLSETAYFRDNKLVGYIRLVKTPKLYVIYQLLGHHDYQNDNKIMTIIFSILRE